MELNELHPAETISVSIATTNSSETTQFEEVELAAARLAREVSELMAAEYTIDSVGDRIWLYLSRPTTVAVLRDAISAEFSVQPERCERDIRAWLQQLVDEGLLKVCLIPAS